MTPNLAQGANCSIEDAASLANILHDALDTKALPHRLCGQEIDYHLRRFNKIQVDRMTRIYRASRTVVRLQTRSDIFWRFILRYYVPYAGTQPTEKALKILEDAVTLSFIPLPQRSGPRWVVPKKRKMTNFAWAGAGAVLAFLLLALIWRP
jgi:2-polyprenyl-6-methoxyphenol hydroxylase-like FAD-dependent oxidoreductase